MKYHPVNPLIGRARRPERREIRRADPLRVGSMARSALTAEERFADANRAAVSFVRIHAYGAGDERRRDDENRERGPKHRSIVRAARVAAQGRIALLD